jgi:hypothetical protein
MSGELESFIAEIPARAAAKDLSGLQATYTFVVEGGKAWTIRIEAQKVTVSDGIDANADCAISATEETFTRLLGREQGVIVPTRAFPGASDSSRRSASTSLR